MNILITGGAGYIGTELVRRLATQPYVNQIIVYDNLSRGNHNLFVGTAMETSKIRFVPGDLLDSRKLRKLLAGVDSVFHLAAKVTTPYDTTDSHFYEQVNHWGTAELVYAIEESKVAKLFFVSSASVYGSSSGLLTEDSTTNPETFYAVSKLRAESHVRRLFGKLNTLIIRCGNVYGYSPSMRFDAVINRFMFDANFTGRISIYGNGRQYRSFLHVDKLVSSLVQLLNQEVPSGTYNLTDKNLQVLDIVDVLKEIYPELEFMFINQHLSMKEIQLDPAGKIRSYVHFPETDLKPELVAFREKFAFSSADVSQPEKNYGRGI